MWRGIEEDIWAPAERSGHCSSSSKGWGGRVLGYLRKV